MPSNAVMRNAQQQARRRRAQTERLQAKKQLLLLRSRRRQTTQRSVGEVAAEARAYGQRPLKNAMVNFEKELGALTPQPVINQFAVPVGYTLPLPEALECLLRLGSKLVTGHSKLTLAMFIDSCTIRRPFHLPANRRDCVSRKGINAVTVACHWVEQPSPHSTAHWYELSCWLGRESWGSLKQMFDILNLPGFCDALAAQRMLPIPVEVVWVLDLHALLQLLNAKPVSHKQCCPYCDLQKSQWRSPGTPPGAERTMADFPNSIIAGPIPHYDPCHMLPQVYYELLSALWFKHKKEAVDSLSDFLLNCQPPFRPPPTVKRLGRPEKTGDEKRDRRPTQEPEMYWCEMKHFVRSAAWWRALQNAQMYVKVVTTRIDSSNANVPPIQQTVEYDNALQQLVLTTAKMVMPFCRRAQALNRDTYTAVASEWRDLYYLCGLEPSRFTTPVHIWLAHGWQWTQGDVLSLCNEGGEHLHQKIIHIAARHPRLYATLPPFSVREAMSLAGLKLGTQARCHGIPDDMECV